MLRRLAFVSALLLTTGVASAQLTQSQGLDAMKRLAFLNGTWTCTYHGGPLDGQTEQLSYSFSANGRWMVERSDVGAANASSVQVWGYDPAQQRLVAHQYTVNGISTKTVSGWQGNQFVSTRDDNHWQVVLQQDGTDAMSWIVRPDAADAQPITEACKR